MTFEDLYRRKYRSMVLLAFATTRSADTAEDLVQDAFAQLYRRWDQVHLPEVWLRRALISMCTSWVRRCRPGTVKSMLNRARATLERELSHGLD